MELSSDKQIPNYFQEINSHQWSLIDFLEWRSENLILRDRNQEHGLFKSLLQNIIAYDKDNIRKQKALELHNNWQVNYFSCDRHS